MLWLHPAPSLRQCTRSPPPMFGLDNYPRRNLCRSSSCLPASAITATSLVWRMRGLIHIHISDHTVDILCYCQYEYWSTNNVDWTGNRYACGICYVLCGIKAIKGLTEGVGCLLGLDLDPRTSWVEAIEGGSHNH